MRLEDITRGPSLEDIQAWAVISVVAAVPIPRAALQRINRLAGGTIRERPALNGDGS